jgi:hypothetical protein
MRKSSGLLRISDMGYWNDDVITGIRRDSWSTIAPAVARKECAATTPKSVIRFPKLENIILFYTGECVLVLIRGMIKFFNSLISRLKSKELRTDYTVCADCSALTTVIRCNCAARLSIVTVIYKRCSNGNSKGT